MEREQIEAAIEAQERLRGLVPDDVVDTAIASLRDRLTAARTGRRRQATVMFADVHGFTRMAEGMDPEHVSTLMNDIWERLDAAVVAHGGLVDKHIGDALMAVWGANQTHEDDPERGVRAALAVTDELRKFVDESGVPLTMRVGVNTGLVMFDHAGTTSEVTAIGDAVNTASRLEHAAVPGSVLISHETYRHVRGLFDVVEQQPLLLKGKREPARTYIVEGIKPRAFRVPSRGIEGIETPTIGRDDELEALRSSFLKVLSGSGACTALVVADAGIGKSRLLWEFGNWIELRPESSFYLEARSVPGRSDVPLSLVRNLVADRCGIVETDGASAVYDKLLRATDRVLTVNEAATLGAWLGLIKTERSRRYGDQLTHVGRAILTQLLRGYASDAPVVVILEDLHWADGDSLEALAHALKRLREAQVLVVAAVRPEGLSRLPASWTGADAAQIRLGPLDATHGRNLVRALLAPVSDAPGAVEDLIVERAEGNAFFAEELVKILIDEGVIDTAEESWTIHTARLNPATIPDTVTGVIQARLEAAGPDVLAALQAASIVGRVFWREAVAHLSAPAHALDQAVSRELIYPRSDSAFADTAEYIFKHALIHDVTYETVLVADRPGLHQRVADWLQERTHVNPEPHHIEIGEHRQRAGQIEEAAELFLEASRAAERSTSVATALELTQRGIGLLGDVGSTPPVDSLLRLARCHLRLGDVGSGEAAARHALDLAGEQEDRRAQCEALYELGNVGLRRGNPADMLLNASNALPIAQDVGGPSLNRILTGLARARFHLGEPAEARRLAERAIQVGIDSGVQDLYEAYSAASAASAALGDHDASVTYARSALETARAHGDVVGEAEALDTVGLAHHCRADATNNPDEYDEARRSYSAGIDVARRIELLDRLQNLLGNLAQLYVRIGEYDLALETSHEALSLEPPDLGLPDLLWLLLSHAEALIWRGEDERGFAYIEALRDNPLIGHQLAGEADQIIARAQKAGVVAVGQRPGPGNGLAPHDILDEIRNRAKHLPQGPIYPDSVSGVD